MRNTAREQEWIVVRGMGSISGFGYSPEEVRQAYKTGAPTFGYLPALGEDTPVSFLSASAEAALQALLREEPTYATLDRSVQLAILATRQAVAQAGWKPEEIGSMGINIGSSRGATGLFEHYHTDFLTNPGQRLSPSASPSTTLGNVASWVANDVQASGPLISHSVTCSTALQAFANGLAWLKAGMAKRFLVGGTEAPLTPFTIAQMKAIGIYSKLPANDRPCRPLNQDNLNTFVLGEGAAMFALERMTTSEIKALHPDSIITVEAVGMGFERSPSKTGLSPEGTHFQLAMRDALTQAHLSSSAIDAIVLHAPGTRAGDAAEETAVHNTFRSSNPAFLSNKAQIGHTLGASGALSAHLAIELLQNPLLGSPFLLSKPEDCPRKFQNILVNAAGFGGNAASLLLARRFVQTDLLQ